MEHLFTNITGLDMALCLALLLIYLWSVPKNDGPPEPAEELDTNARD
ncbi:MAG: hypothetical protein ACLFU7_10190 [Armatimonadota bacterium]